MREEEAKSPERRKRVFGLSMDMIVAISAVIVSVCAILVSLMQTEIMRRQQAADVWPHVSLGVSSDVGPSPALRVHVQNSGVGPALIRWVEVRLDGKPMTTWEALGTALTDAETAKFRQIATLNGRVVMAGETTVVHQPYERSLVEAFMAAGKRLEIDLCYCSIQGACWTAKLHDLRANRPANACPATNANTFTQ